MSLISVIIPIFNVETYIKECTTSLLNQSFRDFELLFIDDMCEDKTVDVIKTFKDERIKIFKNNKKGAGCARNFGLTLAKGKWIVFFDGDDFCHENYLSKLYKKAEEKDADVVICGSIEYLEKKKKFLKGKKSHALEFLDEKFENSLKSFDEWCEIFDKDNPKCSYGDMLLELAEPWNKIYRRDFLIENDLKFADIPCSEDLPFSYGVLFNAPKISFVKENLVFIRRRPSSLSFSVNKNWKNYFIAYKITDEAAFNYPHFEKIKNAYFDRRFRTYKYFYKKAGVLNKIPYLFKFNNEIKYINRILNEKRYNLFKAIF